MTHIDFFPYHNRHIVFKLNDGSESSGVVVDPMNSFETGKADTIYRFIATKNMVAWKKAEKDDDKERMKNLEMDLNIEDIVWAEKLNLN